eukprot:4072090-Pleurochrysis_carterae.AAC.1
MISNELYGSCTKVLSISRARARAGSCCERFIQATDMAAQASGRLGRLAAGVHGHHVEWRRGRAELMSSCSV